MWVNRMANNTGETRRRDKRSAERQAESRRGPSLEATPLRGRPANENDPGTSMMMARLHRRPSYVAYFVAIPAILAWVFGWFMAYSPVIAEQALPKWCVRGPAAFPVIIMGIMAYLYSRAQQLRQVSEVLMQSAMRLIRPQDIASRWPHLHRPGRPLGSRSARRRRRACRPARHRSGRHRAQGNRRPSSVPSAATRNASAASSPGWKTSAPRCTRPA